MVFFCFVCACTVFFSRVGRVCYMRGSIFYRGRVCGGRGVVYATTTTRKFFGIVFSVALFGAKISRERCGRTCYNRGAPLFPSFEWLHEELLFLTHSVFSSELKV